jgi:hypothetical protein
MFFQFAAMAAFGFSAALGVAFAELCEIFRAENFNIWGGGLI